MPEANETAVVVVCGGCGYPTLGSRLCAFCLPMTDHTAA